MCWAAIAVEKVGVEAEDIQRTRESDSDGVRDCGACTTENVL